MLNPTYLSYIGDITPNQAVMFLWNNMLLYGLIAHDMSEAYLIVSVYTITERDLAEFGNESVHISALELWLNKIHSMFSYALINFIDTSTMDIAQHDSPIQGLGPWIVYDDHLNLFYSFGDLDKTPIQLVGPKPLLTGLQRRALPKAHVEDSSVERVLAILGLIK